MICQGQFGAKNMRILQAAIIGLLLITPYSAVYGGQQSPLPSSSPLPSPPWSSSMSDGSKDKHDSPSTEQQKRMRIAARQKQLVEDANRLLALATELKAEVDKSGQGKLPVEIPKKAEQIEKLAHGVKVLIKDESGG
jgi:hypothetical protein